jgi:hypothetical protein
MLGKGKLLSSDLWPDRHGRPLRFVFLLLRRKIMSKRLACAISCIFLICLCICPLLEAATYTLSQSGLMALDYTGSNPAGGTLLSRVPSGSGVEYLMSFPAGFSGLVQSPSVRTDNSALLQYGPGGVDPGNPTSVASTPAIMTYANTYGNVIKPIGFIVYPVSRVGSGWPALAEVRLRVEPAPGATPVNFDASTGFPSLAVGDSFALKFTLVSLTGVTLPSGDALAIGAIIGYGQKSACTVSLSAGSQSFTSIGGKGSLGVTAQSGCAWTASSDAGWVTITSGASGSGNGTIEYGVASNSGSSPRSATINIAGQTFSISQTGSVPITLLFAHVAVGGGWGTNFTIINTGSTVLNGTLILTDRSGGPLTALLSDGSSSSSSVGSSLSLSIQAGGSKTIRASGATPLDSSRSGWARVESTGGNPSGIATFQLLDGTSVKSIAGVLSSQSLPSMTIPVDNEESRGRFTGFAVANPNASNLAVRLILVGENGTLVESLLPQQLSIAPQGQVALFLHEILPSRKTFKGTMVLIGQGGLSFPGVGLIITDQGLITTIPTISGKAPNIPE